MPPKISTRRSNGISAEIGYNNGDTAAVASGGYTLRFRQIAGWVTPPTQTVGVPANSTNIFTGLYTFASLSGDYQGLFSEASEPKYESCGFCEITGGKGLSFTAKISSEGHKYPFSGKFDTSGNVWGTIPRSGTSPLSVHFVAGEDILTGEISNETWTATILAKRNTFDAKNHPASQAGKYTFAFVGDTNSATQPAGDSFGTMTVDRSGGVTLAVTMSDGTKASQKTILGKDGTWPFYASLYSGKGFACGWLQLQGESELNPPKAELYRQCDYAGGAVVLAPGDYTFWTLYYAGLYYTGGFDYNMGAGRSVTVPKGWTVTLYTNDNFSGTPFTKTMDDSCFADDGLNTIQSIRVGTNGVQPSSNT